jgi:hypothetical protein
VTTTLGSVVLFLLVVGIIIAVGIGVGMIVAGRVDRIMAPPRPQGAPADPAGEPESDAARTEEHHE